MAIWQIDFNVIDKNKKNTDEDICYWNNEPVGANDVTFLEKEDSWSKDIIQFGSLESTCIELLLENSRVVEVSIRLDLRTLNRLLLSDVIDYIKRIDANIYYNDEIITPSYENICSIIRASDAHKYCSNPVLLFAEL